MSTQQQTQASEPATQGGSAGGPTTYAISGVQVNFPVKAYPSQIAMMNKVIQGLKQGKHCLLESPTGSGKTLALLCATLAWQRHEAVRVAKYNAELEVRADEAQQKQNLETPCIDASTNISFAPKANEGIPSKTENEYPVTDDEDPINQPNNPKVDLEELITDDDSDDDFKHTCKRVKMTKFSPTNTCCAETEEKCSTVPSSPTSGTNSAEDAPYFVPPEKKLSVPKIFFGTRTHKQISQITRELRKTEYKSVRSAILASREHTCVNPLLAGESNKTERCHDLLETTEMGGGCRFHTNAKKLGSFDALSYYGIYPGYDLEDFIQQSCRAGACPYYATRMLLKTADIIFCPYNYLIDKAIRSSMDVYLENCVVIFDEAHNMEDSSREAASFAVKFHEVSKAIHDCEKVKRADSIITIGLQRITNFLSNFNLWIEQKSKELTDVSYDTSSKIWTGTEAIASLHNAGLDEVAVKDAFVRTTIYDIFVDSV